MESLKRKDHFGDLGINARILLKLVLNKYGGKMWTGLT
jgi:hypothetical protein